MVPGFNTDFKYRGETYHVQTEDNGVGNPVVVSLLYHKGAILASRRTPYNELVDRPGYQQELSSLMKNQHKDLMRALLAGEFDKDGSAPMITGGSGDDPAAAAAAVTEAGKKPVVAPAAASVAAAIAAAVGPAVTPAVTPTSAPASAPVPAARSAPKPSLKPLPDRVPFASLRSTPAPSAAPVQPPASRVAAMTLDEAIWDYLKKFAATASVVAH